MYVYKHSTNEGKNEQKRVESNEQFITYSLVAAATDCKAAAMSQRRFSWDDN